MTKHVFVCADCLEEVVHINPNDCGGTGYAIVKEDGREKQICYACCAKRDLADMRQTGRATLYLVSSPMSVIPNWPRVTNWPGTLAFTVTRRKSGRHNLAGSRTDVWFTDSDGARWHGVQLGENSQICRCRRVQAA